LLVYRNVHVACEAVTSQHSITEITFNVATRNLDKNTSLSQTVLLHLNSGDVIPLRIVGYVR
jgi:hypothetical protein